ncbi:MAG: VWA domain-containing protein [Planctomycetes bacterium]|nr:VWA domain-containing protein [Planctomycetota bacterium]
MSFLAGFVALFATLGAIPIIIHLLNKRQFRIVVWAAMEFLLTTMEKNSRRLQMQDLILMALRVAAIVFLALSLARPTIAPGHFNIMGSSGETSAVIVLDNSLSMGVASGNETRYDAAKRRAKEIVDELPKGSAAALLLMSDIAIDEIGEPSHNLEVVRDAALHAPLSDGGTDAFESLAKAWKIVRSAPSSSREIYLITDMQAGAWPAADNGAWMKLVDEIRSTKPAVKLFISDVGSGGPPDNVQVERLQAEDDLVTTESNAAFIATLHNYGTAPARNVAVDLLVGDGAGGEPRKVAGTVIDSLESTLQVRLETRFANGGDQRVEVRTSIDRLPADNRRCLSVNVIDRVRVLLVDGEPSANDSAFGNETDFLKAALSLKDEDSEAPSLIETEVTTLSGLGDKTLREYQAVIIANLGDLPPNLVEGLKTFVRAEGKGLMIFLGGNVKPGLYNDLLFSQAGLLPGTLGERFEEAPEDASSKERGIGMATDELSHPIVGFFSDKETRPFFAKPRFQRWYPITVPGEKDLTGAAAGDRVNVIARFTNNQPAIVERTVGRGSVLLFASTADKEWSDFPLTPAFLMVIRRATQHVTLGRMPSKTVQVHEPIASYLGVKEAGAQVSIRDPRGGTRQLSALVNATNDFAKVEYGDTHFAGFYRLEKSGDAANASWFAANAPRQESNLDSYDEKTLRARYPNLPFQWIGAGAELGSVVSEKRVGKEIWFLLLAIVLACLLAESILALRWAPKGT